MKKFRVAVLDNQFINEAYAATIEKQIFGDFAEVVEFNYNNNEEIKEEQLKNIDGFLAWHHLIIDKKIIDYMKNAKILVRIGMGYDNVDFEYAKQKGIIVSNVPDYGVEEVADSAICLLLNLARRTYFVANSTKSGKWNTQEAIGSTRLNGKILGIIGLGRIGTATALRAKAFGLNVIFYDPFIERGRAKALNVTQVESLEELLSQSDFISVHCPLKFNKADNFHLLNRKTFQHIKKGAFLINTARGPIIEEEALVEALKNGTLKGAGLDVFEHEPYIKGPLLEMENVIVTPHSAFYSDQGFVEMVTKASLEVKRVLSNQRPWYCVNYADEKM